MPENPFQRSEYWPPDQMGPPVTPEVIGLRQGIEPNPNVDPIQATAAAHGLGIAKLPVIAGNLFGDIVGDVSGQPALGAAVQVMAGGVPRRGGTYKHSEDNATEPLVDAIGTGTRFAQGLRRDVGGAFQRFRDNQAVEKFKAVGQVHSSELAKLDNQIWSNIQGKGIPEIKTYLERLELQAKNLSESLADPTGNVLKQNVSPAMQRHITLLQHEYQKVNRYYNAIQKPVGFMDRP